MNFIEKTLTDNEKIEGLFKLHPFQFASSYLLMFFGLFISSLFFLIEKDYWIFLFGVGLIVFLTGLFQYFTIKSIHMGVTNKRIIYKKGLFSIYNEEIQLGAIETIEMSQSIIGRIFGFGNVKITGRGEAIVLFNLIKNPIEVKKIIGNLTD